MEGFAISPDDCLILKALKDTKSLRDAARLLECDPAGLVRRIQTIAKRHGFLQKVNNRWQVTGRGVDLIAWAEASIQSQKQILSYRSAIRLASTAWFSEEILVPSLKHLRAVETMSTSTADLSSAVGSTGGSSAGSATPAPLPSQLSSSVTSSVTSSMASSPLTPAAAFVAPSASGGPVSHGANALATRTTPLTLSTHSEELSHGEDESEGEELSSPTSQGVALIVPEQGFEDALLDGSVDFSVVGHPPENPEIEHRPIIDEEWTIIVPASWPKESALSLEELKKRPFIRHSNLNVDLFFPERNPELKESGIALNNLTGIRAAVSEGLGWSIAPKLLVSRYLRQGRLAEVPNCLSVRDRRVCVWWLRHRYETKRQSGRICSWVKLACSQHG